MKDTFFVATRLLLSMHGSRLKNYRVVDGPANAESLIESHVWFSSKPRFNVHDKKILVTTFIRKLGAVGISGICRVKQPKTSSCSLLAGGQAGKGLDQIHYYGSNFETYIQIGRCDIPALLPSMHGKEKSPEFAPIYEAMPDRSELLVWDEGAEEYRVTPLPTADACEAVYSSAVEGRNRAISAIDAGSLNDDLLELLGLHILSRPKAGFDMGKPFLLCPPAERLTP